MLKFLSLDFPNGFDAELLRQQLVTNHGKSFQLGTSATDVTLLSDPTVGDDEVAIRATCVAHFAMTKVQRDVAIMDAQTTSVLNNGDQFRRFLLTVFFDIESRLRVLEIKPAITKAQYLTALRNVYKNA